MHPPVQIKELRLNCLCPIRNLSKIRKMSEHLLYQSTGICKFHGSDYRLGLVSTFPLNSWSSCLAPLHRV